ncbi:MAG: ABC transporter permease [Balneolaceae bacterium]|nr:ABC transporter permease [Balneolaceae bacterium]
MSLRQILLVCKREYITRIRSKGFILATILIPLGMVAFIGIMIGIAVWESDTVHKIGITDHTSSVFSKLSEFNPERYVDFSDLSRDSLQSRVMREEIDGYIVITENHLTMDQDPVLIHGGSGGLELIGSIRSDLRNAIREVRLERAEVSEEIQKIFESPVGLETQKLTEEGTTTEDYTGFFSALGVIMGVIIFAGLFGYGGLITRSVIEEKTNRIVEIIASSVKPIELMIGKMTGVLALGLSQIIFWLLTLFGLSMAAAPLAGMLVDAQTNSLPMSAQQSEQQTEVINQLTQNIQQIDPLIIFYFILFFILGYLMYSSLFAAIGSAVDSETDTQQLMIPVTIPIMVGYLIMFRAMEDPDGSLAVIGSIIPFFTPFVMITRVAITTVPFWQIGLSILLMLGTLTITMWFSAKIYSVGILSYGKSAGFRELMKWIRRG